MARIKKSCDVCRRSFSQSYKVNGKFLCYFCKKATRTIISYGSPSTNKKTLNDVLNKVHFAKGYPDARGYVHCTVNFPSVLAGRRFKIILVEDEESKGRK